MIKFSTVSKFKLCCTLSYVALTSLLVSPFLLNGAHITSLVKSNCLDLRYQLSADRIKSPSTLSCSSITDITRRRQFLSSSELYTASTTREDDPGNDDNGSENRALGILVLLTVPLAWGTYAPVVKFVYEMDPPVPGFVFSGGYYMIAAFTLSLLSYLQHRFSSASLQKDSIQEEVVEEDRGDEFTLATTVAEDDTSARSEQLLAITSSSSSNRLPIQLLGGLELGSYLFIGNCLQVIGLKTVPADRAAFLVQLTTIMVPLFQASFAGDLRTIPALTWLACVLAFLGVVVMGLDAPGFEFQIQSIFNSIGDVSYSSGDFLIIAAAVAYTMHVIRLGRYAKFTTPLGLAAAKAGVEAIFSIGLISLLLGTDTSSMTFVNDISSEITAYFQTLNEQIALGQFPPNDSTKVIGAILWTGWVTCAYTIYAQSFGQRRVSPTDANLIYSMQPLFSAVFAFVLLGESLGPAGYLGGSFIACALWIVTASEDKKKTPKDKILD